MWAELLGTEQRKNFLLSITQGRKRERRIDRIRFSLKPKIFIKKSLTQKKKKVGADEIFLWKQ